MAKKDSKKDVSADAAQTSRPGPVEDADRAPKPDPIGAARAAAREAKGFDPNANPNDEEEPQDKRYSVASRARWGADNPSIKELQDEQATHKTDEAAE